MNNVLRLAIVDPNDSARGVLKAKLLGMDMVWLEAECSRYEFFSDVVAQTLPDIAFVALDSDPEKALDLVRQLSITAPGCSVLVSSNSTDGNLILRAMRSGVKEFLPSPVNMDDLITALDRVQSHRGGNSDGRTRSSTVISIAGATGGAGSTSVAVNLGCILASDEKNSVALIDLDLSLGDADVFLDTIPDYTLLDVAQNVERLDFNLLKRSLTKHNSGLYLLPRPVELSDARHITPDDLRRVIGLLKASFSHLIIDTSKSYSPLDLVAMEMSEHVLMVTQLDLPCLRNVVRLMMSLKEYDGMKEKIKIVVNRFGKDDAGISLKKAQETIGAEVFWQIPNDYRVMVDVRNNGVPLIEHAPKAAVTQSIRSLAVALCGGAEADDAQGKSGGRRLLGLFGAKGK